MISLICLYKCQLWSVCQFLSIYFQLKCLNCGEETKEYIYLTLTVCIYKEPVFIDVGKKIDMKLNTFGLSAIVLCMQAPLYVCSFLGQTVESWISDSGIA